MAFPLDDTVTTISSVDCQAFDVTQMMVSYVSDSLVQEVPAAVTVVLDEDSEKPSPRMVRRVPPAVDPLLGSTDMTWGRRTNLRERSSAMVFRAEPRLLTVNFTSNGTPTWEVKEIVKVVKSISI